MKKYIAIVAVLLLLVAGVFLWRVWGQTYTIELSEQQLIEKLNKKFPFEKTYFLILSLAFSNPRLNLQEGSNRIAFGCDVETNLKVETATDVPGYLRGTAQLSGVLRYEPTNAAFYLDEPKVEQLIVSGVPTKYSEKVNSAASKAAKEFLDRAPIYELKPTDVKKAAARLVLRDVVVSNRKLVITLGVG